MTKIKVLAWLDSPTASTGFGTVARNILKRLHDTGRFEIEQIGINYKAVFVDKEKFPWQIAPAKLHNPEDPHGCEVFLKQILDGNYDLVFVCNDLHVTNMIAEPLSKVLTHRQNHGKKVPKIINYYPVDCHVMVDHANFLDVAHLNVAYTKHGVEETVKVKPYLNGKVAMVHHGTETSVYRPFSRETQNLLKEKRFGISPDTFLFINVNRNSQRKQLARTIYMFNEFKKQNPKSMLYLHTAVIDTTLDLSVCLQDLGLSMKTDVIFPVNYAPGQGCSDEALNEMYNCADCYITTHLGEGWGLTVTEAMSAGVPVIAPYNTSMPEILGEQSERGFLYECKDTMYIDNSGYRPCGLKEDILNQMNTVHNLYKAGHHKYNLPEVSKAREWVEKNSWEVVCKQWVQLIDQLLAPQIISPKLIGPAQVNGAVI